MHREFHDLSDADIQIYVDAYDEHITSGFQPYSLTLIVGGCFILFVDWLFFNGGSSGTIQFDSKEEVCKAVVNTIVSAVGAVFAFTISGIIQ